MGPGVLAEILKDLPEFSDPALLAGCAIPDDAGVYKISEDLALVQTVDFFTPVVDDPYAFGQVAAANALSDIYAMGAKPLTALNLVAFPILPLGTEVLREIIKGGCDKVAEAGAVILGGHSIEDQEPKYGLAVTGLVHPERVVANHGAEPGDLLFLTKPLGTGVLATALKAEMLDAQGEKLLTELLATLNAQASAAMVSVGVHACTDITGFGLLGHLQEMARNSKVNVCVWLAEVPFLPNACELADDGLLPAGLYANREFLNPVVDYEGELPQTEIDLLFDPQTSGGLLIAVPQERAESLRQELKKREVSFWAIGKVEGPGTGRIVVRSAR